MVMTSPTNHFRPSHRATSTKTRIETRHDNFIPLPVCSVTEQHPRKQGLKLKKAEELNQTIVSVTEQHPRKQGLKLHFLASSIHHQESHRATSTKTRIETSVTGCVTSCGISVTEQHPRKQGLKLERCFNPTEFQDLSQSNIHENKD